MKSLDEINDAFCSNIKRGSIIELIIYPGFEVNYDNIRKIIEVKPAKKLDFGMPRPELKGTLLEYSNWGNTDGHLEFALGDYYFSLKCSQILDFKVLRNIKD